MAVVEDATALAGQETGAVDDVRAVLQERADEAWIVPGVVLEVGVLEEDEVARGLGDAAADRRALALVLPLLQQADAVRMVGGELAEDREAAVLRAVIDEEKLQLANLGRRHRE